MCINHTLSLIFLNEIHELLGDGHVGGGWCPDWEMQIYLFFFFYSSNFNSKHTHFVLLTLKKPSFLSLKTLCDYKIKSTLKS